MTNEKDEVLKIIQKSGNDFHLKVSKYLESKEWKVVNSPYYTDPATNKPREIDIMAEKIFSVTSINNGERDELRIRLFIECKYIASKIVFWFVKKDLEKAKKLATDNNLLDDHSLNSCPSLIHHYLQTEEVTKLYEGEKNYKEDMATATNQVLHGLIFFSNHKKSMYTVNYPVIMVNSLDKLYRKTDDENQYESIADNFQIAVDYTPQDNLTKDLTKYFLIDVVSFQKVDNFLKVLGDNDIKILEASLREKLWNRGRNKKKRIPPTFARYR